MRWRAEATVEILDGVEADLEVWIDYGPSGRDDPGGFEVIEYGVQQMRVDARAVAVADLPVLRRYLEPAIGAAVDDLGPADVVRFGTRTAARRRYRHRRARRPGTSSRRENDHEVQDCARQEDVA